MNSKALHVLEYDKIIDKLTEHATSDPGRKLCKELQPSSDIKEIRKNQEKTSDAIARIFKKGSGGKSYCKAQGNKLFCAWRLRKCRGIRMRGAC